MDHDSLYKKLLTVFCIEFVESFLPGPASYIDPGSIEFLDKETFSGIRSRKRKELELNDLALEIYKFQSLTELEEWLSER